MSKKMMIFYSFPFNFLWKSLMTLMTVTLMTLTLMTGEHQFLNVCLWYKYFTFAK